jgi:Pyruvate-formate lyase
MNRIRKIENIYQVLITPVQKYNAGFEILRGSFNVNDQYLTNYTIMEFSTLYEAQNEASKYPDLDWDSLVLLHQNVYIDLKKYIKNILDKNNFIYEYEPRISTSASLKNIIFDRVMKYGKRFVLSYNMNDIISFNIINPWSCNLEEMSSILESSSQLKIIKKMKSNSFISLIGKTDVETNYEIRLWPTLLYNWAKWNTMHNICDNEIRIKSLNRCLEAQNCVDEILLIR